MKSVWKWLLGKLGILTIEDYELLNNNIQRNQIYINRILKKLNMYEMHNPCSRDLISPTMEAFSILTNSFKNGGDILAKLEKRIIRDVDGRLIIAGNKIVYVNNPEQIYEVFEKDGELKHRKSIILNGDSDELGFVPEDDLKVFKIIT